MMSCVTAAVPVIASSLLQTLNKNNLIPDDRTNFYPLQQTNVYTTTYYPSTLNKYDYRPEASPGRTFTNSWWWTEPTGQDHFVYEFFFNWFCGPNTGPASRCKYCTVGSFFFFFFPLVNCISCKQHISLQGQKCIWTVTQSFCGYLVGDGSYYCDCSWLEGRRCCPRPTMPRSWLCAMLSGRPAAVQEVVASWGRGVCPVRSILPETG